jgi:4-aminobutyrate aminotransferase / (S)-3-amino-2-methylpropionate transaminase / 5-aminovalerate transaminase
MTHSQDKTNTLYEKRKNLVPNGLGIFNNSSIVSGHNATVIDADGRDLIDFGGGIGVLNAGHTPPSVVAAIKAQCDLFIHSSFNVSIYESYLTLAEKLVEIAPHGDATKVMLTNSGAEAVENAIKFARQATKRQAILCFHGAFHGRTLMAASLTSNLKYKVGGGPFSPEVYKTDYPHYRVHDDNAITENEYVNQFIEKFEKNVLYQIQFENLAAIILEIVQGEGGFYTSPNRFLQYLRDLCDRYGIMLIFDEVQSGFGRTGAWASYQVHNVVPDLSTWAKSIASGMPLGAVIGKAHVMDAAAPSSIGGTYSGNPLSCAAAIATIDYMTEININQKGIEVGKIVRDRFDMMMKKHPNHIYEVRGLGAMLAMEFYNNDVVKKVTQKALDYGVILISSGAKGQCIRVLSPLTIELDILEKGLNILEKSIEESI